jgi:PhzF family phenazine biosynthesis protein
MRAPGVKSRSMPIPLFQVDAFTDRPFRGNPAGVCLLDSPKAADWMQSVAAEMNLAETAFLSARGGDLDLRWFTPTVEVDLCGHATLATAHVLWEEGRLAPGAEAAFHTKSGRLSARRAGSLIEMDFPSDPPRPADAPAGLDEMLGVRAVSVGRGKFDLLVELESEDAVRAAAPDLGRVRTIPVRGVIVTARSSGGESDFVSRFFAPQSGVDEDPVTGSAHCCLAPFWSAKLGKERMTGYQASKRGGTVRLRVAGDRVILGGAAVTVFRGTLGA